MQTKIPCVLMRGGTSKGPFFLASDLPADADVRDQVLLSVMGSPDDRQIDGLGGADPLTSKVAIIGPATREDCDVDYLFAQVVVDEATVDVSPNCGNMLAGVGPFAIEHGLIAPQGDETVVRIHMVNSGDKAIARIKTPGGQVEYHGEARIDGVPGTHAPILIDVEETAGSFCGALLPTGNAIDVIDGVDCTLMDNGMPVVAMRAADLGRAGYETRDELNADEELKVDSLGLKHCDYFLNGNIRNEIQSLRMEQQSYISQINHTSWQTSLQRRQSNVLQQAAPDMNYTRLFSWDGQMLLARVKNQHVKAERPSFMDRLMA